jgi:hypothetical protein
VTNKPPEPNQTGQNHFPWWILWVLGALAGAVTNAVEFFAHGTISSVMLSAGWLCWAFGWYARPFLLDFRAPPLKAFVLQPVRSGVPEALWTAAIASGLALSAAGIIGKFLLGV